MNVTTKDRCDQCKYMAKVMGEPMGQCRRYPPDVTPGGFTKFPPVSCNQWCGEFECGEGVEVVKAAPVSHGAAVKFDQAQKKAHQKK